MSDAEKADTYEKTREFVLTIGITFLVGLACACVAGLTWLCGKYLLTVSRETKCGEGDLVALMTVFAAVISIVFVVFGFFLIAKANEIRSELHDAKRVNDEICELRNDTEGRIERAAEKAAEQAHRKSTKNMRVEELHRQGNIADDQGRFTDALEAFNTAIDLDPRNPGLHNNRGVVLFRIGRFYEALEAYDKAIELEPDDAEFHINRGQVLDEMTRFEDALNAYKEAIRLKPNSALVHNYHGLALNSLGRCAAGLMAIAKAIEIDPKYADAYTSRGIVLMERGDYGAAVTSYDRAIALGPRSTDAHYNRACAYALWFGKEANPKYRLQALADLTEAIRRDTSNRKLACDDDDFKILREDKEFSELIAEEPSGADKAVK